MNTLRNWTYSMLVALALTAGLFIGLLAVGVNNQGVAGTVILYQFVLMTALIVKHGYWRD